MMRRKDSSDQGFKGSSVKNRTQREKTGVRAQNLEPLNPRILESFH